MPVTKQNKHITTHTKRQNINPCWCLYCLRDIRDITIINAIGDTSRWIQLETHPSISSRKDIVLHNMVLEPQTLP